LSAFRHLAESTNHGVLDCRPAQFDRGHAAVTLQGVVVHMASDCKRHGFVTKGEVTGA